MTQACADCCCHSGLHCSRISHCLVVKATQTGRWRLLQWAGVAARQICHIVELFFTFEVKIRTVKRCRLHPGSCFHQLLWAASWFLYPLVMHHFAASACFLRSSGLFWTLAGFSSRSDIGYLRNTSFVDKSVAELSVGGETVPHQNKAETRPIS